MPGGCGIWLLEHFIQPRDSRKPSWPTSPSQRWDWFPFTRAVLVIAAPRGTCLIAALRPSLCLRSDQRHQARPPPREHTVYLDRRPEEGFILVSAECDGENTTLGRHSAGQRLFRSVNREITPCMRSEAEKKMLSKCWMRRTSVRV